MTTSTRYVETERVAGDTQTATSVSTASVEQVPLSVRGVVCVVDFGAGSDLAVTTVRSQPWVTSNHRLVPAFFGATDDHDAEDALLEGLRVTCGNVVEGIGFDVIAHAPDGTTGTYNVHVIGV